MWHVPAILSLRLSIIQHTYTVRMSYLMSRERHVYNLLLITNDQESGRARRRTSIKQS